MNIKKWIMRQYRTLIIGEKRILTIVYLTNTYLLILLVLIHHWLAVLGIIGILISYFVVGYIDRHLKLSKLELEADLEYFNPVVDLIEKIVDKKIRELQEWLQKELEQM